MREKIKRVYKGKYQRTIYIWISVFFIIAQTGFSAAILVQTKQQTVQNNYKMNELIFQQIAYNMEQSDQVIKNVCKELFVNPKISKMMYGYMEDDLIYEWIREYQSVCDPILFSNPQIHSIYVYNSSMDQLFSSYRYMIFEDQEMMNLLGEDSNSIPMLHPFIRTIENPASKTKTTKVITYVLYEAIAASGKPDGAIIVNVELDKITDEIRKLLTFSEEEKSEIFIFSQKKMILDWKESEIDQGINTEIQNIVNDMEFPKGKNFVFDTKIISGEKYGIFFTEIPGMDWIVVKIQSYDEVFSYVNSLIMMIVVVSAIVFALVLTCVYFLSRKIYSPIGKLVEKVKKVGTEEDDESNEIQYLNRIYETLYRRATENQKKNSQNKIILTYNLKNLLEDGKNTDPAVWEALQVIDNVLFQKDNFFGVSILQIDDFRKIENRYNHKEQKLYNFMVENVFSEILENRGYRSVMIPMEKDKMLILLHGNTSCEQEYRSDMEESFRSANEYLKKYFQVSFSISVGSYGKGMEAIRESYCLSEKQLPYRWAFGKTSIVFYDYQVEQADSKETEDVMKLLNAHVQEGTKECIPEDFAKITELVKRQDSDKVMEFIISNSMYILHMMEIKEKTNNVFSGSVIMQRYTEILSLENWDEMSQHLQKMLMDVLVPEKRQAKKTNLLVGTVQKIIQEEYEDPNLCLQQISDIVKMSSQYVGRIFKGTVGISVSEYINEFRLNKSVEIMMETGCTVSEVLEAVGIENESQYYRMFKKKYGTTPKAYMMELMMLEKEEE